MNSGNEHSTYKQERQKGQAQLGAEGQYTVFLPLKARTPSGGVVNLPADFIGLKSTEQGDSLAVPARLEDRP